MPVSAIKKHFFIITISLIFCVGFSFTAQADEGMPQIPPFEKSDRVLIFAPHPDDETIGAAGVIQRALKAGATVYVACYTNGDANQLAFIVYEKRLTVRKGEFLYMGEVRRKETIAALKFLGVDNDNIIFLGYPDFGTMQIMLKYWGPTKPYSSMFTRSSSAPYQEDLSPFAPYVGESILKDIKTVLIKTAPTKIFVSNPADTNGDHESLYLFLRVALWDLQEYIKMPQVYPFLVHCVGWPKPRGYHPELELIPPPKFEGSQIIWQKLDLTADEIEVKNKSFGFYKSQIPYNPAYLPTFARKNELFGDYPAIILRDDDPQAINWHQDKVFFDLPESHTAGDVKQDIYTSLLSYAKKDNKLYIKLSFDRKITKGITSYIYLLGYSKKASFSRMPKFRMLLTRTKILVYEKKSRVPAKDVKMSIEDNSIIVEFPLEELGSPDYILSYAKTYSKSVPSGNGVWRVLEIK